MSEKSSLWVERFLPHIKSGGNVLDLACGRGRHALRLHAAGYRVEAVDRNAAALADIARRAPAIHTRVADLGKAASVAHCLDLYVKSVTLRTISKRLKKKILLNVVSTDFSRKQK